MDNFSDIDRGAVAALSLLLRGIETSEGEEDPQDTAETIRSAIESDGLAVVIRRQMDYERDFIEDAGPFPAELKALCKGVPKTVWKGGLR